MRGLLEEEPVQDVESRVIGAGTVLSCRAVRSRRVAWVGAGTGNGIPFEPAGTVLGSGL